MIRNKTRFFRYSPCGFTDLLFALTFFMSRGTGSYGV
jgi:hypothetical protein